jgi:hypothetical protein
MIDVDLGLILSSATVYPTAATEALHTLPPLCTSVVVHDGDDHQRHNQHRESDLKRYAKCRHDLILQFIIPIYTNPTYSRRSDPSRICKPPSFQG